MPRFTPQRTLPAILTGSAVSVVAYIAFFFTFYSTWHRFEEIAHHGRPAIGTVVEKQPMNHQGVRFHYSVEGAKYFGEAPAGMNGLPKYEQIEVGDLIPVTYWDERPSESVAGDSTNAYRTISFLLFVLLPSVCLILGGMTVFGLRVGTTFTWLDLIRWLRSSRRRSAR
jgi:hypothetical protein